MKFTAKLAEAPAGSFHVLDPEKAKRLNAKTLYIPSPEEVRQVIDAIPAGAVMKVTEMRHKLAVEHGAETACPAAIQKYWRWMAWAMETEGAQPLPWWRVTRLGRYGSKLPGGSEGHKARLADEGVKLRS